MQKEIEIKLVNKRIRIQLNYVETAAYFDKYIVKDRMVRHTSQLKGIVSLNMDEIDWKAYPAEYKDDLPYVEFGELICPVSEMLLSQNMFCFHGLAFLWKGKAYIFTGRSGIGKSTQYKLWKELYSEEIRILNGDKPVICFREDGSVWVYPSPWTGKEKWGSLRHASLGGIICLDWGENQIAKMEHKEAVYPILKQIFYRLDTDENCHRVAALAEQLILTVPIWKLQNLGNLASAQLTHDFLLKEREDE